MLAKCVAKVSLSPDGKYLNCTEMHPTPGTRFSLVLPGGSKIPNGNYTVEGDLEFRQSSRGNFLLLTMTAIPKAAEVSIK